MPDHLLTLVRHGRTHANAGGLLQGHVDNELDPIGIDQAAMLGPALVRVAPVARIISSPLRRAQQTATAIAEHCGTDVETDVRWIFVRLVASRWRSLTCVYVRQSTTSCVRRTEATWWW
ncbi:MAG: histidine phosphatase family protein [Actinobacteria bacterium]|nr:histidine phosphatase family protein [Actinomycetota bacterium]